jgi:hypothetical protein
MREATDNQKTMMNLSLRYQAPNVFFTTIELVNEFPQSEVVEV